MTFLPIVERELRSAARRKGTFRLRTWAASIAILVTFVFLVAAFFGGGATGAGSLLLQILSGYTAGLFILASLFLTADCISEEKREGTLGFLFLTELHGYDVVLGKFIAKSLNTFYSLMALLPVMAISLLLGGLTGLEFWRTALSLINALFVSLAAGIFISSFSWNGRAAVSATFSAVMVLFAVLPIVLSLQSHVRLPAYVVWLCELSPGLPFYFAYEPNYFAAPGLYWKPLIGSDLLGWLMLAGASLIVTRTWQEKDLGHGSQRLPRFFGRARAVRRLTTGRSKLLDDNPVAWLIGKEPAAQALIWCVVIGWALIVTVSSLLVPSTVTWAYHGAKIASFLLKILIASQACRFFVEARGNGMLELLLSTPMRSIDILRGQWLALQRMLLWPLLVFVLSNFVPLATGLYHAVNGPSISDLLGRMFGLSVGVVWLVFIAGYFLADIFAVCWFGTWLSLRAKKPALAPLWTVLFVVVLPLPLCFLDIIADLFFIIWAVVQLNQDFRWLLAKQYEPAPAAMRVASPQPPVVGPATSGL